jgi:signal transduction histidine kinase
VQDSIEGNWDRVRIDQAITNLISNAIKYAEQPVEVLARLDDGQAVISISDHGPGIPPGELERIFDRFERDGGDRLDGFGLGLWITRQIVQAHGGTTIAQSRVGEGSRFEIRLPIPRLTD